MKPALWAALLLSVLLTWSACSRGSLIGGDFFDPQNAAQTDTVTVWLSTLPGDSSITSNKSIVVCGRAYDPFVGGVAADFYTQVRLSALNPSFYNTVLDSVVLSLVYATDTVHQYGDFSLPQTLRVKRVTGTMSRGVTYFSNQTFETGDFLSDPISFIPNLRDSVRVITGTDSSKMPAMLRIPLYNDFGAELMSDSLLFTSNDVFNQEWRGLQVLPVDGPNSALLRFNLYHPQSRVTFYFRRGTTRLTYSLLIDAQTVNANHYERTPAIDFDPYAPEMRDSIALAAGLSGPVLAIQMPWIRNLRGVVVNKAELQLFALDHPDNRYFKPITQAILYRKGAGDNDYGTIPDVSRVLTGSLEPFGGQGTRQTIGGQQVTSYRMNIAGHLQAAIDGRFDNGFLYLIPLLEDDRPNRSLFAGSRNGTLGGALRPKLILTYSIKP